MSRRDKNVQYLRSFSHVKEILLIKMMKIVRNSSVSAGPDCSSVHKDDATFENSGKLLHTSTKFSGEPPRKGPLLEICRKSHFSLHVMGYFGVSILPRIV